ncbi:hypothetical protein QFC19_009008 [Naganishia cerealis]|uniref:Uncharacterized protein n=1 Tax=Naganishia cerealis TaxID=610337 RepID=A0ACC2UXR6_9TREE|nr:hypothetical protein QFC19_009008 [Naganishia cerealis]
MVSPQPQDTSLLQPTYSLPPPPPALDPREPAPPPITSPGGHIHISRNRSTGTPRTPCTPTRSPALSPASSRAASPVPGPDGRRRRERGSFGANVHPVHGSHMAVGSGLNSRSSSRGTSPIRDSVPLSHRNSGGSGLHAGMTVMTNSIDAALAAGSKGNSPPSSHLPTSPLSEQDSSPPISSVEGLAFGASDPDIAKAQSRATSGTLSPREKPVARTGSRPIQPHADAAHLGPHLHSGLSGTQTHQAAAIPAGSFLRPVSPALSATASMSDSMIFERDIESPLPPPIPSNVLERRPSRKGSRASGLNGGTGTEFSASSANSLTHSQTHSYSNLHQHYTHGDFLESKIPTVLDDAIEALTALSESERHLYAGGFTGGARSRLVDIEVESPAPVSWAGVGSSASATRLPNTTSRHHVSHSGSRPVSPLRSGITSSKASNPTSPLLDAAQPRPHLSTRASSAGPMLPGAFPSGNEQSSESWRRKIQEWIGPKGLDETSSPVSPENKGGDHEDHIDSHSGETENLQVSSVPNSR